VGAVRGVTLLLALVEGPSGTVSTVIWPACAATIACTMESPKPVPPGFVAESGSKLSATASGKEGFLKL
jgi:hypothetical protein